MFGVPGGGSNGCDRRGRSRGLPLRARARRDGRRHHGRRSASSRDGPGPASSREGGRGERRERGGPGVARPPAALLTDCVSTGDLARAHQRLDHQSLFGAITKASVRCRADDARLADLVALTLGPSWPGAHRHRSAGVRVLRSTAWSTSSPVGGGGPARRGAHGDARRPPPCGRRRRRRGRRSVPTPDRACGARCTASSPRARSSPHDLQGAGRDQRSRPAPPAWRRAPPSSPTSWPPPT